MISTSPASYQCPFSINKPSLLFARLSPAWHILLSLVSDKGPFTKNFFRALGVNECYMSNIMIFT